jgi:hypothetical protein
MGWGSIADRLNRTLGGYGSEEEEAKKIEAKVEPKAEATSKEQPSKPITEPEPQKIKTSDDPMQWSPPTMGSIYDAPAITRESIPVGDAPIKASQPRRARTPKQVSAPKEEVATLAT